MSLVISCMVGRLHRLDKIKIQLEKLLKFF